MSRALAVALLALLAPSIAAAGTYRAGPFAYGPGLLLRCAVVNVSSKPLAVEVFLYGAGQVVVGSLTPPDPLLPGAQLSIGVGPPTAVHYCEFRSAGSRKKMRMLACNQNANGDCVAVYPVD